MFIDHTGSATSPRAAETFAPTQSAFLVSLAFHCVHVEFQVLPLTEGGLRPVNPTRLVPPGIPAIPRVGGTDWKEALDDS